MSETQTTVNVPKAKPKDRTPKQKEPINLGQAIKDIAAYQRAIRKSGKGMDVYLDGKQVKVGPVTSLDKIPTGEWTYKWPE